MTFDGVSETLSFLRSLGDPLAFDTAQLVRARAEADAIHAKWRRIRELDPNAECHVDWEWIEVHLTDHAPAQGPRRDVHEILDAAIRVLTTGSYDHDDA